MKNMRKSELFAILIIIVSILVGFFSYSQIPDRIASHWNAQGEVDGYISRFWGLSVMPIVSIIMLLVLIFIPKTDPLKENVQKFRKYFDGFIMLIFLFLFYMHLLTILWNKGKEFNMIQFMIPALALLFYYSGILISHAEKNWFIGIRTPWTLSSENVWQKTHKLGGKFFKVCGAVSLIGLFFPDIAIWIVILPVIFTAAYLTYFSYKEYRKEFKK